MKKRIFFVLFLLLIFTSVFAESSQPYTKYPTCGLQINAIGGFGFGGNENVYIGFDISGDIGFRFYIKPINELYLLESEDKLKVYVKNYLGLFAFADLSIFDYFDYYDSRLSQMDNLWDIDKIIGVGLHLELPTVDIGAVSLFFEPSVGYDFNDKQVKLGFSPGISFGPGKIWKHLDFQMQFGLDTKVSLSEGFDRLWMMAVLGVKFTHDFKHSRYLKTIEEYEQSKIDEQNRQAKIRQELKEKEIQLAQARKEQEQKRQNLINEFRKDYTVYKDYLFPSYLENQQM